MKKFIATLLASLATLIANKELAAACTFACYQPELPEEE